MGGNISDPARPVGIALFGCGVVGSALARLLQEHPTELTSRSGLSLQLRHVIVRDLQKQRDIKVPRDILSNDPRAALADPEVDIFVELAGGTDAARTVTLEALRAGKNIVTANKALLAVHGEEVFAAARAQGKCIAFEAAVCGGIPLIESIRRGLIANEIRAVYGILNGTCNYILTQMLNENLSYANALSEAQRLGYAEADPSLDVNGIDSAHKLTILAFLAMRHGCAFSRVQTEGIGGIELTDLRAARELGYACKLLAVAEKHSDGLDLSVRPTFIRLSHPLANIDGAFNAVSTYGSAVGHTLFYGRGAGGFPTASAVISDIIDIATGNGQRTFNQLMVLPDQTSPAVYRPAGENESAYYLRIGLIDRPGGIAKIAQVLGDRQISIASLVQHEPHKEHPDGAVPVLITTHRVRDRIMRDAVGRITSLDVVMGKPVCIPVLNEPSDAPDA